MSRRWVVQIDTDYSDCVYLRRHAVLAGLGDHPVDEPETLPVTIPYATKFVTKREATALAVERGIKSFTVMRTWW